MKRHLIRHLIRDILQRCHDQLNDGVVFEEAELSVAGLFISQDNHGVLKMTGVGQTVVYATCHFGNSPLPDRKTRKWCIIA